MARRRLAACGHTRLAGAVDHVRGYLFPSPGREAVEENGARRGEGHQRGSYLVGPEGIEPLHRFRLLAHGDPDVRRHGIGAGDRLLRRSRMAQAAAEGGDGVNCHLVETVAGRASHGHFDTGHGARQGQAASDVVAVAHPGQSVTLELAAPVGSAR